MNDQETQMNGHFMTPPTQLGATARDARNWQRTLALIGIACWLSSCAGRQPTTHLSADDPVGIATPASHLISLPSQQSTRAPTQPNTSRFSPETADHAQAAASNQNPLYAWPSSVQPQRHASGHSGPSSSLATLAYEKILLDRVSPTALRHEAITALVNAPDLQVDLLSDAVLIAIVLDTLHHSARIRTAARSFIMTYAGPKVVRAYEAVLADVRASAEAGDEDGVPHQDWLARIGLEMYYQDGQRQIQQILEPNAESRQQLAHAIASFQKAWALRTLASADQQYLFPKALYGWAHALEDRAWLEQDTRGMPRAQYAQAAKVKYQEFITEARQYQDKMDYPHRAHLYHAESQQRSPQQRGSLKALAWRTLSLTGSFETGADEPHNFAGLAGNFDGQGLSFGAIQWNIGQQTLPELLSEINRQQATVIQSAFGPRYDALREMLSKTKTLQLDWAKSVQNAKFVLYEPWRKAFQVLGTEYDAQKVQVEYANGIFQDALKLCQQYQVRSERAVALMFDMLVQNGGIRKKARSQILNDFKALSSTGDAVQDEVARLRIIAQRVAEASNPQWVEDVRRRKLTIANGAGTVHGKTYDLTAREITLLDYQTHKPLSRKATVPPLVSQASLPLLGSERSNAFTR